MPGRVRERHSKRPCSRRLMMRELFPIDSGNQAMTVMFSSDSWFSKKRIIHAYQHKEFLWYQKFVIVI